MKKQFFVIALIITLAGVLCACGEPSPTETVESFLKAVQEKDADTIKEVYADNDFDIFEESDSDSSDEDDEYDEIYNKLEKKMLKFEYTVSDEKIDGDKATVKVKIVTYPAGSAMRSWYSEFIEKGMLLALGGGTDDQMDSLSSSIMTEKFDAMKKDYSQTVKVALTKKDGKWVIDEFDEDGDFHNAISGGMVKVANEIDEDW